MNQVVGGQVPATEDWAFSVPRIDTKRVNLITAGLTFLASSLMSTVILSRGFTYQDLLLVPASLVMPQVASIVYQHSPFENALGFDSALMGVVGAGIAYGYPNDRWDGSYRVLRFAAISATAHAVAKYAGENYFDSTHTLWRVA